MSTRGASPTESPPINTKRQKITDSPPSPSPPLDDDDKTQPIHLHQWIQHNTHLLQPPVGNKLIYGPHSQIQLQIVGGPNTRTDYHLEKGEEFFYQIKGDMLLRTVDGGYFRDIVIREGEVFLLPGDIPHSPQRYPGTIGLVIERKRDQSELDGLRWYCGKCHGILLHDAFHCEDLGTQLKVKIDKYYATESMRVCKFCGHLDTKPTPKLTVVASLQEPGRKVREFESQDHPAIKSSVYPDPFNLNNFIQSMGQTLPGKHLFSKKAEFQILVKNGEENKNYEPVDSESWFHQLKGSLRIVFEDKSEVALQEGEMYLMPPNKKFTCKRDAGSIGLSMVFNS